MYVTVRSITAGDWLAIDRIQQEAYPQSLYESLPVLQSKEQVSPDTCWVAQDQDDRVLGYLLSHRWHDEHQPPALNTQATACHGDLLYLHDLAVDPVAQKQGVSAALWRQLVHTAMAQNISAVALVAVNNSADYWAYKGFDGIGLLDAHLGYGERATWMKVKL